MANRNMNVVVGKRQILREIKVDKIAEILIAADAEQQYMKSLMDVAKQYNVKYTIGSSMEGIAFAYGIDVPTGAVGILK